MIHVSQSTVRAVPGLVLPQEATTGLGCLPVGDTVHYICTVDSIPAISTIWVGSALSCQASADRISLVHVDYGAGVSGVCGTANATSVSVSGSEYTSMLSLLVGSQLQGTMINCTISNIDTVGSHTIRVGGKP